MAKFKIVTTGAGGTDHSLEMEALAPLGAEIVEVKGGDDELAKAVVDADAIHCKGRPRIVASPHFPSRVTRTSPPWKLSAPLSIVATFRTSTRPARST